MSPLFVTVPSLANIPILGFAIVAASPKAIFPLFTTEVFSAAIPIPLKVPAILPVFVNVPVPFA